MGTQKHYILSGDPACLESVITQACMQAMQTEILRNIKIIAQYCTISTWICIPLHTTLSLWECSCMCTWRNATQLMMTSGRWVRRRCRLGIRNCLASFSYPGMTTLTLCDSSLYSYFTVGLCCYYNLLLYKILGNYTIVVSPLIKVACLEWQINLHNTHSENWCSTIH